MFTKVAMLHAQIAHEEEFLKLAYRIRETARLHPRLAEQVVKAEGRLRELTGELADAQEQIRKQEGDGHGTL
jgi:hypothetical protein